MTQLHASRTTVEIARIRVIMNYALFRGDPPGHNISEDNELSLSTSVGNPTTRGPSMKQAKQTAASDELLAAILKSLDDDKAEDVVSFDLRGKSEIGDHMVIATGRSTRQVSAMAEKLVDRMKQTLGVASKVEGKDIGDWVLIDTGDVIVHIFRPEVREFYQLEKMWTPGSEAAKAP